MSDGAGDEPDRSRRPPGSGPPIRTDGGGTGEGGGADGGALGSDSEGDPAASEPDEGTSAIETAKRRVQDVSMRTLPPSARSWLGGYVIVAVVLCLVIAAAGASLAYNAQTTPETELQTETAGTWEPATNFSHSATVTNESLVFETGERLENRPLYFTRVSPVLEGEYTIEHEGDADAAIGVTDVRLVYRATEELDRPDGDGGTTTRTVTHWRETEAIATEEFDGLAPGERHTVDFEANATALDLRLDAIEEDLGATPGTREVVVIAETAIEAEVGDERFIEERTDRLGIEPGGGTYSVEEMIETGEPYEATTTVEVPVEPSPLELYGGPILLFLGLLGAGLFATASFLGAFTVTPRERRRLTYERAREDYDKWISRGIAPDDDRDVIELDSLEDLVNVAIDSDRRVIESRDTPPRYVAVVDDIRYAFEPPALVVGDAGERGPESESEGEAADAEAAAPKQLD